MRLVPSVSQRICCGNTVTGHSCMGVSFFLSLPINQSIHRSIDPSIHRSFRAGADAPSAWGPIIRAAAISVNRTLVMTHITQVNITLTTGQEIAAPSAQGHVACRWRERVKRKVVLGKSVGRELLPMGLAWRTACVAGRSHGAMHS